MRLRLLDVGAGCGALVWTALQRGHAATGIEPSVPVCHWAWREHGVPLVWGDWLRMAGRWDVVAVVDVLEHLVDPGGFMARAGEHGDFLYVETPDWTPDLPSDWPHIRPRAHPVLYSEAALIEMGRRAGWQPVAVERPVEGKLVVLFGRVGCLGV